MNKKCITIQEYQKIVLSNEANEESKRFFDEICQFVDDFTGAKNAEDDVSLYVKKGKEKSDKHQGTFIQIMNYVGLIELPNGYQIDILPKIYFSNTNGNLSSENGKYYFIDKSESSVEDKDIEKTKLIFTDLFCALNNIKKIKTLRNSNLEVKEKRILDIFISMFLDSLNELVKRGLKSIYLNKEDNVRYYKGKLLLNKHLKFNIAHKEKFYMEFDEFSLNRPENKLLKSTLAKLLRISRDANNINNIRKNLVHFDLVNRSTNFKNDFKKVIIDKNTKSYEELLKWAEVFLNNKTFLTFSGTHGAKALLFKMNDIFESYVARRIKYIFGNDYKVKTQSTKKKLFDKPKKFTLKPDIIIYKDNDITIMDTKWKKLMADERKNYGISQMDMYQMYAYATRYAKKGDKTGSNNVPKVYLLYPYDNSLQSINDKEIKYISDTVFGDVEIEVFTIKFTDKKPYIDDSLKKLKDKILAKNSN